MVMKMIKSSYFCISMLLALAIGVLFGCTVKRAFTPEEPYYKDADRKNIPEPVERDPDLAWTSIKRSAFDQLDQGIDVDRTLRKWFGTRMEAHNMNGFDEVPNSTWFTNRHAMNPMTSEELTRGPVNVGPPDTIGDWEVFRPKIGGTAPGFWIKDSNGDSYLIKFDPPGYGEMATGAGAVGARYFHACGYNVPEETIVYWRPEKLKIGAGVTVRDGKKKREFTQDDLRSILDRAHKEPDGRIRSLASKAIEGKIKGPFSYSGKRRDDPNDWCTHEKRRELRGLYVIASFINHYDCKDHNTLDSYIEENGNHFIKHYLTDFNSTLGSDGRSPKPAKKGYSNAVDLKDMLVSLVTLGLKEWRWERSGEVEYPSVGYFESKIFEPHKFESIIPNPAFEEMTYRDAYWGAKIVMSFSKEDLQALLKAGQYSDPQAEKYILQTLLERQDKIGRYWFGKVNPLDNFEYTVSGEGMRFRFEDLAVKYGFEDAKNTSYKYSIKYFNATLVPDQVMTGAQFSLSSKTLSELATYNKPTAKERLEEHLYELIIKTKRGESPYWSKPVVLWLWYDHLKNSFQLVGIEHRSS
jgi:hypothetical protein